MPKKFLSDYERKKHEQRLQFLNMMNDWDWAYFDSTSQGEENVTE